MTEQTYRYDVAFSFLQEDEALATQLNDLVQERLQTFLYSRRQNELAGADGEDVFNRVFGGEARVVVVLYRKGWGQTPWTRIKETAIRNRAFEDGWDFTVFIPRDNPPEVPRYLPKTRIWAGLDRWGVEGAATVIESRVQEAGGTPRTESFEDRRARLTRDLLRRQEVEAFLNSAAGLNEARTQIDGLFTDLEGRSKTVSDPGAPFHIRFERGREAVGVIMRGVTVTVFWQPAWSNSLDKATLIARMWDGPVSVRGAIYSSHAKEVGEYVWAPAVGPGGELGWKSAKHGQHFFTTEALANELLTMLIDRAHKRSIAE